MESIDCPSHVQENMDTFTGSHAKRDATGDAAAMPWEVLSHIFVMGHTIRSFLGPPFEVLVSHVCNRWRQVAIRTPVLWSSIEVLHGNRNAIECYLIRSMTCPLHLRLQFPGGIPDPGDVVVANFPQINILLLPHLVSCQCLSVLGGPLAVVFALRGTQQVTQLLQHMSISLGSDGITTWSCPCWLMERGALPVLTSPRAPVLPLTLCLESTRPVLSFETLRNLVTFSSSLTHLWLSCQTVTDGGWLMTPDIVHLPSLRSLHLQGASQHGSQILLCISAPGLASLSLHDLTLKSMRDYDRGRSVQLLRLSSLTWGDGNAILSLLRAFSNVVHLEVTCHVWRALSGVYSHHGRSQLWSSDLPMLANLRKITLRHPRDSDHEGQLYCARTLVAPVISPMTGNHLTIRIRFPDSIAKPFAMETDAASRESIDVELLTESSSVYEQ
jgi:hypothetical protein